MEDDSKVNEAAKELSKLGASKGGHARAQKLSPEERSAIARQAVEARWEKAGIDRIPKAMYGSDDRPLRIGKLEIPCYVLEDRKRVLVQGSMLTALDMKQGTAGRGSGDRLIKFLSTKSIKPYADKYLQGVIMEPIKFRTPTGQIANGYEAILLADICDAVLEARKDGNLNYQQEHIAKQCEILVRGFARVGIIALVDEATGYQDIRDRVALQKILDKYLTDEWAKWTKKFPDEYYKEIFRLKNIPYPPIPSSTKKPSYVGHWTNDIIYSRLAPGVLDELKRKNPLLPSGNRSRKFFQHLTVDYGHPELKDLLSNVIFLMKTCKRWDDFKERLDLAKQKYGKTLKLHFQD